MGEVVHLSDFRRDQNAAKIVLAWCDLWSAWWKLNAACWGMLV